MKTLAYVCVGGAVGAGARYLVGIGVARLVGVGAVFPWATLCVNVIGSLLMGVLIELMALKYNTSLEVRALLATGVLGGFTTFSAFSLDVVTLMTRKEGLMAAAYVASSIGLSVLALYAGLALVRQVLT